MALATALVTARADAEGSSYFQDLSERNPADATAQALAGFFQVRAGQDVAAAVTQLDKAATMDAPRTRGSPVPTRCSGGTSGRPRRCDGRASALPRWTSRRCSPASR